MYMIQKCCFQQYCSANRDHKSYLIPPDLNYWPYFLIFKSYCGKFFFLPVGSLATQIGMFAV